MKTLARVLLESGQLEKYLEQHPQSARRIQEEMMDVSMLSSPDEGASRQNAAKTPARVLLESGQLEKYLEEHPQSARRVQEEMMEVSMLSSDNQIQGSSHVPVPGNRDKSASVVQGIIRGKQARGQVQQAGMDKSASVVQGIMRGKQARGQVQQAGMDQSEEVLFCMPPMLCIACWNSLHMT